MWRIFHLLFKWDYVAWRNNDYATICIDGYSVGGIARVYKDGTGSPYYIKKNFNYKTNEFLIHKSDVYIFIEDKNDVVWLTCAPEKYMKEH